VATWKAARPSVQAFTYFRYLVPRTTNLVSMTAMSILIVITTSMILRHRRVTYMTPSRLVKVDMESWGPGSQTAVLPWDVELSKVPKCDICCEKGWRNKDG